MVNTDKIGAKLDLTWAKITQNGIICWNSGDLADLLFKFGLISEHSE